MSGFSARTRPAFPILNKDSVLAEGLVSMVAAPLPQDLAQGTILTGTMDQRGFGGVGGSGFQFNASAEAMRCTAPGRLQLSPPLTIAARVVFTGTPNTVIYGLTYNSTASDPFLGYALGINGTGKITYQTNLGLGPGSFQEAPGTTFTPAAWVPYSIIAVLAPGSQDLYVNGSSVASHGTLTFSISYGTGPIQSAGEPIAAGSGNLNAIFYDGMIWNRALSATERAILDFQSPWDLYWQPSNRAYSFMTSPVSAGGFLLVKN